MRLGKGNARALFLLKLIGIPLLIISFAHPINGLWSALGNVILASEVTWSVRALISLLYAIAFFVLFYTAWKNMRAMGFVLFAALTGVVIWAMWDFGWIRFNGADEFGWIAIFISIIIGYIAVFGANAYRMLTGRYATDSEDPDTSIA